MKNSQKYTFKEIRGMFDRNLLAQAVSATTCYEWTKEDILKGIDWENGVPEKSQIRLKDNMIDWIMNWLDDETIPEDDREDMIEFLNQFKEDV